MTVPDAVALLRERIATAPPDELPSIRGHLAELEAEVLRRLVTPAGVAEATTSVADPPDRLLTVDEAAAMLNQKPQWVRAHQRELHVVRLGRLIRFSERQLAAIIRRRSHG